MITEIVKQIETRITELNKADKEFCKSRWDMTKPEFERAVYREHSNEATFARQELQKILQFVNGLIKAGNTNQFCIFCESVTGGYRYGENDKTKCSTCGNEK